MDPKDASGALQAERAKIPLVAGPKAPVVVAAQHHLLGVGPAVGTVCPEGRHDHRDVLCIGRELPRRDQASFSDILELALGEYLGQPHSVAIDLLEAIQVYLAERYPIRRGFGPGAPARNTACSTYPL